MGGFLGLPQRSVLIEDADVMGRQAFTMSDDPDWFAGNYQYQLLVLVLAMVKTLDLAAGGTCLLFRMEK